MPLNWKLLLTPPKATHTPSQCWSQWLSSTVLLHVLHSHPQSGRLHSTSQPQHRVHPTEMCNHDNTHEPSWTQDTSNSDTQEANTYPTCTCTSIATDSGTSLNMETKNQGHLDKQDTRQFLPLPQISEFFYSVILHDTYVSTREARLLIMPLAVSLISQSSRACTIQ